MPINSESEHLRKRVVEVQISPERLIQRKASLSLCVSEEELSMAKAKKQMADKLRGTTSHDLTELVGKKIKEITLYKVAVESDGSNVREFYRIKVAGRGENEFILACDGGNTQQYARATLMYPDDFEAFLSEIESEDSEPDVDDEEDADLEDDGTGPVPSNLFDEIESEDDEEDVDAEDDDAEDDDY